jgi:hypothetical protein
MLSRPGIADVLQSIIARAVLDRDERRYDRLLAARAFRSA